MSSSRALRPFRKPGSETKTKVVWTVESKVYVVVRNCLICTLPRYASICGTRAPMRAGPLNPVSSPLTTASTWPQYGRVLPSSCDIDTEVARRETPAKRLTSSAFSSPLEGCRSSAATSESEMGGAAGVVMRAPLPAGTPAATVLSPPRSVPAQSPHSRPRASRPRLQ